MKRVYILLSLIVFLFFSCSEDNTLYEPQEKENVAVDNTQNEDKDEEEELPEGQLLPGMHTVKSECDGTRRASGRTPVQILYAHCSSRQPVIDF